MYSNDTPLPGARPAASPRTVAEAFTCPERLAALFLIAVSVWAINPVSAQAQDSAADTTENTSTVLEGTISDASDGLPLPGANVVIREEIDGEVIAGASTNFDGVYRVEDIVPGEYVVTASFVGYNSKRRPISILADRVNVSDFTLRLANQSLDQVVVSASRRQERIVDAPASVSVLRSEDIRRDVSVSSAEALRNVMSVDVAKTGINNRELALRGFNNAFSGDAFVLTDYREASVPALDVNIFGVMPIPSVDVDRVEVVRGPGSALYGPGVSSGVIQFFSRNPFDDPGTTISVAGGSRSFLNAQFRQAGTFETLGYKVTGSYTSANEWELQPGDPVDDAEIENYRIYDERRNVPDGRNVQRGDFNGDGDTDYRLRREDEYRAFTTNGLLEWRPNEDTRVALNGGYNGSKTIALSGIGTTQADMYGYRYGQLRVRSGGFFGQVFYNALDSGDDSYVYGSGDQLIDSSFQWNGQLQYTTPVQSLAADVTFGTDANFIRPRTGGTINGRFEGEDAINEIGAYTQSTFSLGQSVDLTAALRGDYNSVTDQLRGSPRGALVYRVTPDNSVRFSYNRSYSSPKARNYFLDIEARRRNVFSAGDTRYDFVFSGIGAVDGFTFNTFRNNRGTAGNPAVRLFIPNVTGTPDSPGFGDAVSLSNYPVAPVYRAAAALFSSQLEAGDLDDGLQNALGAQGLQTYGQLLGALAGGVNPNARATEENNNVILGTLNADAPLGYREVPEPRDIDPLGQTMTQTFEIGYKGESETVAFDISGYYEQKENFVGPLRQQSPFVYLSREFAGQSIQQTLDASPAAQALVDDLVAQTSLRENDVYNLLAQTLGRTPTGVVQPDGAEELLPGSTTGDVREVGGFFSLRNFGEVQYWGLEGSIVFTPVESVELYTNASYISDDFFDNEELDEANEELSVALNAPTLKMRNGINLSFNSGWRLGLSSEYVDGFPVQSGPYNGSVDSYTLFDMSAGYVFDSGLRFDVSVDNLFNNEHREFIGAPQIGRLFLGRVTYEIQ